MSYVEFRKSSARGTDSIAADIMRHLHTRQHLGKAVVITGQPIAILAAARKQWLKLARALQKQRASTLNADKILKFTHTITRMQYMQFSAKGPLDVPDAEVHFLHPDDVQIMPVHCYSVYVLDSPTRIAAAEMLGQLPSEALVIDYAHKLHWIKQLGLQSKHTLEHQVDTQWRQVLQFLRTYKIDIALLASEQHHTVEAMDDALDTLLGMSHKFLLVANEFQRSLELARPLRVSNIMRQQHDALMLLAHRVQALSPGAFTQHFLETYNEDDTFFLNDVSRDRDWELRGEELATLVAQHIAAGRHNLARALQQQAAQPHRSSTTPSRFQAYALQ